MLHYAFTGLHAKEQGLASKITDCADQRRGQEKSVNSNDLYLRLLRRRARFTQPSIPTVRIILHSSSRWFVFKQAALPVNKDSVF